LEKKRKKKVSGAFKKREFGQRGAVLDRKKGGKLVFQGESAFLVSVGGSPRGPSLENELAKREDISSSLIRTSTLSMWEKRKKRKGRTATTFIEAHMEEEEAIVGWESRFCEILGEENLH